MNVAALPIRLWEHFDDRPFQSRMIVADREDHPAQATSLEAQKELFPTGRALPVSHFHAQHLTPSLPVDPARPPPRAGANNSIPPQLFIARIDDQVGILALELTPREAP